MKNNDFEFVKNKFDNAQQDVPHTLDASVIEYKLMAKEDHRRIKFDSKKPVFKPLAAAVACLVLVLGIVFASNPNFLNPNKVAGFDNYEELNQKLSTLETVPQYSEMGGGICSSVTYTTEDGVEYPNIVKYYNGYIFYAYFNCNEYTTRNMVYIFKEDGTSSKLAAIIDNVDSDEYELMDILTVNNRLIVNLSSQEITHTKIYDISNCEKPSLISEFAQSGKYSMANVIGNKLFVFTKHEDADEIPYIEENGKKITVSSDDVVCFENVTTARYAVINCIDIEKGAQSDYLKAVLGGSPIVHSTKEYIYINEYINGEDINKPERDVKAAMKLNVNKGRIEYADEEEIKLYSEHVIDIGKGDGYSSHVYPIGDYYLSIGNDIEVMKDELILFDKNFNEIDKVTFDVTKLLYMYGGSLAVNDEKNVFAVPAYFVDETQRYYGALTFEIKDGKIVIKDEFINDDENMMYPGECVFVGDYLYSFSINDLADDEDKLKIFAHKY